MRSAPESEDIESPCPFCGWTKNGGIGKKNRRGRRPFEGLILAGADPTSEWVLCEHCGATGPFATSAAEAVKKWNERA